LKPIPIYRSPDHFNSAPFIPIAGEILGQLGLLAISQQAFQQALDYFSRSLTLYEKIGSQKGSLKP
jgi:hypothetical protein